MWSDSKERRYLEKAFSILRFRHCRDGGVVSFRRFVILGGLGGRASRIANELRAAEVAAQPVRAMRR